MLKRIASTPFVVFALEIACRNEPAPLSEMFVTIKAGSVLIAMVSMN
jgi:hypothetical protein